jgi:hypothetical protein
VDSKVGEGGREGGRERETENLVFLTLKWVPTSKYQEQWFDTWILILS